MSISTLAVPTVDITPPTIIDCPASQTDTVPVGSSTLTVSWIEPRATDDSGATPTVGKSHEPGQAFPIGTTDIVYTFSDQSGNTALCSFMITLCKSETHSAYHVIVCQLLLLFLI